MHFAPNYTRFRTACVYSSARLHCSRERPRPTIRADPRVSGRTNLPTGKLNGDQPVAMKPMAILREGRSSAGGTDMGCLMETGQLESRCPGAEYGVPPSRSGSSPRFHARTSCHSSTIYRRYPAAVTQGASLLHCSVLPTQPKGLGCYPIKSLSNGRNENPTIWHASDNGQASFLRVSSSDCS